MSILTYINEVPLYTNIDEALKWAKYNNIIEANGLGYHIHKYKSVTGYMGGKNHSSIPLNPINPPIKPKTKAGYLPPIGSTVVTIVDGVVNTVIANVLTTYDKKGFPQNEKQVIDGVISRPEITTTTQPTPETGGETDANTSGEGQSRESGGGGGGGGY